MQARMKFNYKDFEKGIAAAISKVERGTKKATVAACEEILEESLKEVPRETDTLAQSADYTVKQAGRQFEGEITYGVTKNPENPKTNNLASEYAVIVHEDMSAVHFQGKAKYLEDPVLQFASKFPRSYRKILKQFTGM